MQVFQISLYNLRVKHHLMESLLFLFFILFYCSYPVVCSPQKQKNLPCDNNYIYNKTYPLTLPVKQFESVSYEIAIVSDMDVNSKSPHLKDTWRSFLKKGKLIWEPSSNLISVEWEKKYTKLTSNWDLKGRGMELSELIAFDGKLLTFDDKSGIVYFFQGDQIYSWVILMDGNGISSKGNFI